MATTKKTTKKKTTKKTTIKKTTQPTRAPAAATTATPAPKPTPPAAPAPHAVPIEDYCHMGERMHTFQLNHPDAVMMELHLVERGEAESALSSLDEKTPVMVCTPQKLIGGFTAIDLENLGFSCFYNGKFGKLVGIRK